MTTTTNGLTVNVSVTAGTATVTLNGGHLSTAQMQTLIDALAYRNSSENPTEDDRVVTLTSLKDSGGTDNGGSNTRSLTLQSTVSVVAVNDDPTGTVKISGTAYTGSTLTVTQDLEDLDGLGTFSYVWEADGVAITDATESSFKPGTDQLNKTITVTISYTDQGGTLETVTSSATTKVVNPPEPEGTLIDGVRVSEPTPGTAPDGSPVTVVTIPVVATGRQEDFGNSDLADIPLITGGSGGTLLQVGIPVGFGLQVETPTGNSNDQDGLSGLIAAIRSRTSSPNQQQDQQDMTGIGRLFLNELPGQGADLLVRTLTPTIAPDSPVPTGALVITNPSASSSSQPIGTVIDTSSLPAGTTIELNNIDFAAIIGSVTVTGGAGRQVVIGDSASQFIFLGADDDVLRGGGGDDFVGSRGGDDRLYGDSGNDHLAGGAGNDYLEGGTGNDILQGGASDAGTWQFSLVNGELVSRFTADWALAADAATLAINGPWWTRANGTGQETDHRLQFTYESVERLQLVATLYKAAVGERAELLDFNAFTTSNMTELQLSQAAVDHFFASQGMIAQAIEVQVALLVKAVWGEDAVTDDLINIGTDFITSGGSWAEGMLILAKGVEAHQLLKNADGELVLVNDLITSETGRDQGHSGDDTLLGGAGNDRLIGGGGNNFMDGGEGTDVVVYTGAPTDFTFQLRNVDDQLQMVLTTEHSGNTDVLQNIEVLKIGGYYYGFSSSINDVPYNTDHALENHLVQLTAQQVQSMDLAGIY